MIVALFGVTCVGKTTIGRVISDELNCEFYDLDSAFTSYFNDTIENLQRRFFLGNEYDHQKGIVLKSIIGKCSSNTIIAMSPIYYTMSYKHLFTSRDVFSIVLQDTPENIARRVIYTDANDNIIENPVTDYSAEIKDIKYFIARYKSAFSKIDNHYFIDGKSAEDAASDIVIHYALREKMSGQISTLPPQRLATRS